MRISLFAAIPLAISLIALVWWNGVKGKDFLTPPASSVAALERKKQQALDADSGKKNDTPTDPLQAKAILVKPQRMPSLDPTISVEQPKNVEETIDVGDLMKSPGVETYADFSEKGSEYFVRLATLLETRGELQRALLAWERVLDSSLPNAEQRQTASAAIDRLSAQLPPWIVDPTGRIGIKIHASSDSNTSKVLEPILAVAAEILTQASSGILTFKEHLSIGKSPSPSQNTLPIALWFSSEQVNALISKTITIPPGTTDPLELRVLVLRGLYKVMRDEIGSHTTYRPPLELAPHPHDPAPLFRNAITRLHWHELAKRLTRVP